MRIIRSSFAALVFVAAAAATPITLTFSGTGSGSVGTTGFSNQTFTITFMSDTSDLYTIPNGDMDAGDVTTPDPTMNMFTIGTTFSGSLTGLTTSGGVIGPAVFLNADKNDVGIWFFETADWLVTASDSYTSSYGLANNISVSGLSTSNNGAFGNDTMPATGAAPMESTVGAINFTELSDVTFTESLGSVSGPSGSSGPIGTITSNVGAVPEPSTLAMLGIGIAGIAFGKIRRKRA